jgi:pyruvate/2-oxoglutarate dehydrogenase complex dihydrolipoamide dehydrogenase (E3) component
MPRIVIMGGGIAGYEAALVAAAYDADVTVVERAGLGGGCVLYDCVPSKTFIASAGARSLFREAGELGIVTSEDPEADVSTVHGRVKASLWRSRRTCERSWSGRACGFSPGPPGSPTRHRGSPSIGCASPRPPGVRRMCSTPT